MIVLNFYNKMPEMDMDERIDAYIKKAAVNRINAYIKCRFVKVFPEYDNEVDEYLRRVKKTCVIISF
jgi:hypothetical protein